MRDQTTPRMQGYLERVLRKSFNQASRQKNRGLAIRNISATWALSYQVETNASQGILVTDPKDADRVFSCTLNTTLSMYDPDNPELGFGLCSFQTGAPHIPNPSTEMMGLLDNRLRQAMQVAVNDYYRRLNDTNYSRDKPRSLSPARSTDHERTNSSVDNWDFKEMQHLGVACSRRTTEILNGSDRSPFDAQGTVADHLIKSVVYADHIRMAGVEVPHTRLGDFNGQGQLIEKKIHEQSSHGFFYVRVKMLTQRGDRALRHPQFFRLPIPLFHPSSVTKEHVITGHAEPFLKTLATFINAPNLPTGVYPTVCFDAGLIGHEALWGHLASAGYLPNDECSAMPPRGAQVFTIPITIYDDPTLKNAMGSYRFDAEGEPGRRTRLVHNGNFEHFLTDRQSAGFLGVQNNGHSRIEFYDPVDEESNYFSDGLPQSKVAEVRTSNTVLECPQTITLSEMRREAKKIARGRGLDFYVELLQANGGDVDISSGAVTGNHVLAYTVDVRTGRKKPVRGVNLSGNSQDILLSIVGVGENPIVRHGQCLSESGTIPVTESSPPLLSRGLPYKQVVTIAKDPLEPGKKYHHF